MLAPLAADWNRLDAQRKKVWRDIAARYPQMSPDEQQRIKQQMQPWAHLTPQQRQAAREQYKSLRQLPPEKKNEVRQRWQEYQNLPPEQRTQAAKKPGEPGRAESARTPAPANTPPRSRAATTEQGRQ